MDANHHQFADRGRIVEGFRGILEHTMPQPRSGPPAKPAFPRAKVFPRARGPGGVARRIVVGGIRDPREVAELMLSVAEGTGARGFQYRELGSGTIEVLVDGDEGLADDIAAMVAGLWPGSTTSVEVYEGRVMDLDLFKRVLYTRDHPEEAARRSGVDRRT
ncbi:hypothetical protein [Conexivisphaera calida]|uniref:Uncharacterized protein n=1 Tax=Conexivisphaera calida TaxID=1874277 RepID=A0A4V0P1R6_9ARCH|nr:hypothetical protein [Conexivisphaera calida]BBE42650.1 hypothetical protein NAS2_1261 [Conexivisphaera calida]